MVASPPAGSATPSRRPRRRNVLFRAPRLGLAIPLIVVIDAILAAAVWWPNLALFADGFVLVFVLSSVVGSALTPLVAEAFGGRFGLRRSIFLALTVAVLELPIAVVWRAAWQLWPGIVPGLAVLAVFLVGPMFWFRYLTLYGVSNPNPARTLPSALVQPSSTWAFSSGSPLPRRPPRSARWLSSSSDLFAPSPSCTRRTGRSAASSRCLESR